MKLPNFMNYLILRMEIHEDDKVSFHQRNSKFKISTLSLQNKSNLDLNEMFMILIQKHIIC